MSESIPPQLNWLRGWRWCYSSQRLLKDSESLVIWSAAGNHPPLTLLEALRGCFCCFQVGFFGILLSLFPWVSCFWMRAFLVLSTGPCQPGCSAQPSPASTTAASAKTLAQSLRMCLWSPSYRNLICATKKKKKSILIPDVKKLSLCSFS